MSNTAGRLWQTELALVSPTLDDRTSLRETGDSLPCVELALTGHYKEVIDLFTASEKSFVPGTFESLISFGKTIKTYVENSQERELEVLTFGISCMQLFVLDNWTGPHANESFFVSCSDQKKDELLQLLEVDGEPVYHLVNNPVLLYMAMKIFQQPQVFAHFETSYWWCLRYLSLHQQLLTERSPFLHQLSIMTIEKLESKEFLLRLPEKSHKIQLHLEIGLLQLHYYQYKDADGHFQIAHSVSGISCSLDGALGVRTKFQQKAVAQLKVKIERKTDAVKTFTPRLSKYDIPKALPLNDDTLLEAVKFTGNESERNTTLSSEEQAIVLTMCTSMQKSSPAHRLRDEQILCVIEHILSDPKCLTVHYEALRLRCLLERDRSRTVERSMMQLESLVKHISSKSCESDTASTSIKRLALFYSTWPKPTWMLQKQLALLFASLGVSSSALDIYMRLQMWEDAIICLIRTERGHEAEKLIREQLKIKEKPNLYCLLGDILQDPSQYSKAWELSKHRSARAMRSLGAYKVSKKLHKEAIECFEKSLKANYLQVGTWFSMGCSALAGEDYDKAAKSFQKCVSLNWDNFAAWTNLSTAFVRSSKKVQAHKALTEGLRCNFNRWEMWENYLFISVDTGNFRDAIRAYNRLLDLKDKYVETAVLEVLVKVVVDDVLDATDLPASKLKPTLLTLFGRLTSKSTSDWEVWSLYAKLLGDGTSELEVNNNKALHYLQKALRSSLQRLGWEKEHKSVSENVNLCNRLVDACTHHSNGVTSVDQSVVVSTRLSVNGVKAKLKMHQKSLIKDIAKEEYEVFATELEEKLKFLSNSNS